MALDDDPVRVGATIRALRECSALERKELASRIFISPAHLANIEAGRRPCSMSVARSIANALNVPLAAITTASDAVRS